MLPDDYLRKMKQDLSEVEAKGEAGTRYEPDRESYNVVGLRGPLSDNAYDVPSSPGNDQRCTMPPSERDTPPPDDDGRNRHMSHEDTKYTKRMGIGLSQPPDDQRAWRGSPPALNRLQAVARG